MNLGELYNYFLYILNQDALGEPANPVNFGRLLKISQPTFMKTEFKSYSDILTASGMDAAIKHLNNSPLHRHLKTIEYELPEESEELAELPENMFEPISGEARYNNIWRPCELKDITAFNKMRFNMFSRNVKRRPIFVKKENGFAFIPRNIRRARVQYIETPPEPVFDHCVGVKDVEVYYMEPGSYVNISSDQGTNGDTYQYHLYSAEGDIIARNVSHPEVYNGEIPYSSKSVELDWDKDSQVKIIDLMISSGSIRSRENIGG